MDCRSRDLDALPAQILVEEQLISKSVYRQRNLVERCFNHLKQLGSITRRYEKNAQNYLAMLTLASILLCL
ncbi:transposase [Tolypothrix campylonemoides VB511288]|nr:transposase [Tolypothrix campylonemoides VB511288]